MGLAGPMDWYALLPRLRSRGSGRTGPGGWIICPGTADSLGGGGRRSAEGGGGCRAISGGGIIGRCCIRMGSPDSATFALDGYCGGRIDGCGGGCNGGCIMGGGRMALGGGYFPTLSAALSSEAISESAFLPAGSC